jgi:PIN domain nuclease of toxin-antitoxin system
MKLVLDSHAFFWWTIDHPKLSRAARLAIEDPDNEVYASAVVAWEMATKVRIGKWPEARGTAESFDDVVARNRFAPLPISTAHARVAGFLPIRHGDPFDRMLAAQAQIEQAPLVTADPVFREFGVSVIW